MKKTVTYSLLLLTVFTFTSYSQDEAINPGEYGSEYVFGRNDADHPCVYPDTYKAIEKQITENCKVWQVNGNKQNDVTTMLFSWPLKTTNGLNDCSYYFIANYLDQDPTSAFKDYNCGTVTYDGHAGTDIALCPYPFYKMDNNQVSVIAAAAGTISARVDGNFDKNCGSNTLTPNYIAVNHPDGSNSIYLHMKKNSLTVKTVGQTVITGEYLGSVGSSGASSSPHLHFEVWSGNTSATLKDSYAGPCNALNAGTWWASQKPYTEPAIIKASVQSIAPVLPTCPATETPNEDSCFAAGASARFYIFIRNETIGMTGNMRIINPGGTTFSSWTHNSVNNYLSAYWYSVKTLPSTPGTYTFEAIYNGITCIKTFSINCGPTGVASMTNGNKDIKVYPNPANDDLTITADGIDNDIYYLSLKNVIGQTVMEDSLKTETHTIQKSIAITGLPNGIYFLTIETDKLKIIKKIIKQN